jgi:hypothetical protein
VTEITNSGIDVCRDDVRMSACSPPTRSHAVSIDGSKPTTKSVSDPVADRSRGVANAVLPNQLGDRPLLQGGISDASKFTVLRTTSYRLPRLRSSFKPS